MRPAAIVKEKAARALEKARVAKRLQPPDSLVRRVISPAVFEHHQLLQSMARRARGESREQPHALLLGVGP